MYEFWYDYVKLKHGENGKLCYMDTDMIFTKILQKMLKQDLILQLLNQTELPKPLPKEKYKNVIELMNDELGGQIMKEFVGLRAKAHSYLKDNNDEDKKVKDSKNVS